MEHLAVDTAHLFGKYFLDIKGDLTLERGGVLKQARICYHTFGKLNEKKDNVVWVCHALTGNSNPLEWWSGLFGIDKFYSPSEYFIVCVNVLGSCYGTTNALDLNPDTGKPYFHTFPRLTIRDIVNSFELVRTKLGIEKIHTCIGGSLGGQQAIEWAVSNPTLIQNLIIMAANAQMSPWGIALNETQRMAIYADQTWKEDKPEAGLEGMKVARAIALLSYRSYKTYQITQKNEIDELDNLRSITYQQHQGNKFKNRFNAFSYVSLTYILDSHNVGRYRGSVEDALRSIRAKTLIIGIKTDLLFPIEEQIFMNKYIPNSRLDIIDSIYGHDGFLIETDKIESSIKKFYSNSF